MLLIHNFWVRIFWNEVFRRSKKKKKKKDSKNKISIFDFFFRSHVCYGQPGNGQNATPISKFICPVCKTDELHSFIEFQRHIRQTHNNCDVCFESCNSQEELSQVNNILVCLFNHLIFDCKK